MKEQEPKEDVFAKYLVKDPPGTTEKALDVSLARLRSQFNLTDEQFARLGRARRTIA